MEYHFLGSSSGKFLGVKESLGVFYLPKNPWNSGWDVNGTCFYRAFHRKIPDALENWKGGPVFLDGMFHTEIRVPSRPFFIKCKNWFVQMVNEILERNLPVLNFAAYHLPKQWAERFVASAAGGILWLKFWRRSYDPKKGVGTRRYFSRLRRSWGSNLTRLVQRLRRQISLD